MKRNGTKRNQNRNDFQVGNHFHAIEMIIPFISLLQCYKFVIYTCVHHKVLHYMHWICGLVTTAVATVTVTATTAAAAQQ